MENRPVLGDGKVFFDGSPELTTDDPDSDEDGDTLPHVPCYRFVGVVRYDDLPGYVRHRATFLTAIQTQDLPPPQEKKAYQT